MPRKRSRRRGKGEGSIFEFERKINRKDGSTYIYKGWQGEVLLGYHDDGKRKRKTVYGKTQGEVIKKIAEVRGEVADGTYAETDLTLKSYLERWLKEKERQVRPRTVEFYRDLVRRHIIPNLGRVRLANLTPLQVQTLVGDVADTASINAANQVRTTLFTAMKQAVRWQLVTRYPVEAVEKLKHSPRDMVIWTPEQAAQFLAVAREHRLYAAFYLALSTGLRRGEVLGVRWQDLKENTLHVMQTLVENGGQAVLSTPKTVKGSRRVALSADVVDVLALHRQHVDSDRAKREQAGVLWVDSGLVFTTEAGTPIHPRNFERTWYGLQAETRARLRRELGTAGEGLTDAAVFPHSRFHDLRHLNVSIRRRMGQDAKLIADQIGHSDPAFTMRLYAHLFDDERLSAAVDLRQALGHGAGVEELN